MKYTLNDTWINDDTVTVLPEGAIAMSDAAWDARLGAPNVETHAEKQDAMWGRIQEVRDKIQLCGTKVVIDSVDKWFHTTQDSRIQHLGLNMLGVSMPNNIAWKTMDGTFVTMTPTIAGQIFTSLLTLDMTAFGAGEMHKSNMLAEADPYDYDFSAGWPEVYVPV